MTNQKKDIEILIYYYEASETLGRLRSAIRSVEQSISCKDEEDKSFFIKVCDIFCAESVEKRVFLYTENKIYGCDIPLYLLEEKLGAFGFVQIGKS